MLMRQLAGEWASRRQCGDSGRPVSPRLFVGADHSAGIPLVAAAMFAVKAGGAGRPNVLRTPVPRLARRLDAPCAGLIIKVRIVLVGVVGSCVHSESLSHALLKSVHRLLEQRTKIWPRAAAEPAPQLFPNLRPFIHI